MADLLTAADEAAALEDLHARGFTDGVPVVIPTPARVSRMVLASGLEADMVLGTMGPGHGVATIEKVAVAAVMAGCLPDYMPVVLAAVKAVIDPVMVRYPIRIIEKDQALAAAAKAQVELGSWFDAPLHQIESSLETYGYCPGSCPQAERAAREVVNLPTHPRANRKTAERTVEFITRFTKVI